MASRISSEVETLSRLRSSRTIRVVSESARNVIGLPMCSHHKVPARRLARSISFNKRLAFRARSRFGPGDGASIRGRRREYTSQADGRGSCLMLFNSLRRAFLITADFVVFLRRANLGRARPISASSRIVTVSPMSYIVRHWSVGVNVEFRMPRKGRGPKEQVRATG